MKTQVKIDPSGYKRSNFSYAKAQITVEVVNEPLAHRYNVDLYNHLTEAVFIHFR